MKKIMVVPVLFAAIVLGASFSPLRPASADPSNNSDIVGAWEVTAAAPYPPHLATFHGDGTVTFTNPTNVQQNASSAHGGTNDSVGMGNWNLVNVNGTKYIEGTFEELNAFADNHQPTDTLSVSFKLQVSADGNGFDGPASATLGGQTFPSHLTGARMAIDQAAINAL